jgi:acyl-CoA synthetase (AMP-forming)/AMP-acid ligase II
VTSRPVEAQSIVGHLRAAARHGGGELVFHAEAEPRRLRAAELYDAARQRAGRLLALGAKPGVRVGIVGPNTLDWLAWAWAAWLVHATLVPIPIPLRVRDRDAVAAHMNALARGFGCRFVAAHDKFAGLVPMEMLIEWEDAGAPDDALSDGDVTDPDPSSLAMVVPTSGSTSAPKGVGRTFAALENIPARMSSLDPLQAADVRYLTYSPFAHAGGQVGLYATLMPWLEVHTLTPERFARDPGALFRLVQPHNITSIAGASTGFAAALRSVERQPAGVDLSSVRTIYFSFEMVNPQVVDHLVEVGGRLGLDPHALVASYGLSEGGGTRTAPGQGIRVENFDLEALVTNGVARTARPGAAFKRIASCGTASGPDLRIKGPEGAVPERHVGEVQFRGVDLMNGYEGPGADDPFEDGGWMRTGDVGFIADGDLFITGRIKEVLVRQGKKYHPEDIENAAAQGADVPAAACVAFSPVEGEEGAIVVAVETSATSGLADLEQRVRSAVVNKVGVTLRTVVFVAPETLPKASTGKAQRLAARDAFARGELATNR